VLEEALDEGALLGLCLLTQLPLVAVTVTVTTVTS